MIFVALEVDTGISANVGAWRAFAGAVNAGGSRRTGRIAIATMIFIALEVDAGISAGGGVGRTPLTLT